MIISASRRTDIPALYSRWLMNRVRAGYCLVVNPFNARQVARVSLDPSDVDVIVFWTRHPRPLLPHLPELDEHGYRYVFQYTLIGYPRVIDRSSPPLETGLDTFHLLAERIGPDRITWRYDPIFLTRITDASFHVERYQRIAEALKGCTRRSVISLMEPYRKLGRRLKELQAMGIEPGDPLEADLPSFLGSLARTARGCGMSISSCAGREDWTEQGVAPGCCVDADSLSRIFGVKMKHGKDPSQRKSCGCSVSKDIGAYGSCSLGCVYCYATGSFPKAREHRRRHDLHGESLANRPSQA